MEIIAVWLGKAAKRYDLILAVMLILAVFMIILPLPTPLVDTLIAINIGISIILLMIAINITRPLDFSVFPSVLLITTLYRLALTISTSRLILLQHDAGEIVFTFGHLVVGGNVAIGIIVFTIITIVQFIVITKGSERVAEVSARFSLDGMPGKQMSIDGDMRAGAIDAQEAKHLRGIVQKESQLYGAMDGAMKFVKGDAIASIIVVLVNIIGGVIIGIVQHNMSASEAVATYSVLSVGDGLVAQIPALIISITAGIVVTRVPNEQNNNLAKEVVTQVSSQPFALYIAAGVLLLFSVIPGFPILVFGTLALLLGILGYRLRPGKKTKKHGPLDTQGSGAMTDGAIQPGAPPLLVRIAPDLHDTTIKTTLQHLRARFFEYNGVPIPEIELLEDETLAAHQCSILLYLEEILTLELPPDEVILSGYEPSLVHREETIECNGTQLYWIKKSLITQAKEQNFTLYEGSDRIDYLIQLIIERYTDEFIGVQETHFLMSTMEKQYAELIKELQRHMPAGKLAEILQRLVTEKVSIRNLRAIFEALIEWAPKEKDNIMRTEYVRMALRRHIINRFSDAQHTINALVIGQGIENMLRESIRETSSGSYSALEPHQIQPILNVIKTNLPENGTCVLLTAIDVRRFLRKIIERECYETAVLSFQEIGEDAHVRVIQRIDLIGNELDAVT